MHARPDGLFAAPENGAERPAISPGVVGGAEQPHACCVDLMLWRWGRRSRCTVIRGAAPADAAPAAPRGWVGFSVPHPRKFHPLLGVVCVHPKHSVGHGNPYEVGGTENAALIASI